MTRSRNAVLRRRELLLAAALASGCKHAANPENGDYGGHPERYQVSDPVVPPCLFREGDTITVERHGTSYRFVAPSPDGVIAIKVLNPPSAGQGTGEMTVTLADTTNVELTVETRDREDRCETRTQRVTVPWASIADGASTKVPVGATELKCHVPGPVVTVERVLVKGVATLRIRPTSARVQVAAVGATFSDVVEVQAQTGLTLTVVIQPARDGAACNLTDRALQIQDADLPALGAGPKGFELP